MVLHHISLRAREFSKMIHLSLNREVFPFFGSILNDTIDQATSKQFDSACRLIMDELLQLAVDTALSSNSDDSFEYRVFYYLQSKEYAEICFLNLPTDAMRHISPGWLMLGLALSDILQNWLIIKARGERMKHQPKDLAKERAKSDTLNKEERISELQRYGSWAVKSCKDVRKNKLKGSSVDCLNDPTYRLLSSMACYEKDVDDEYISKRVDFGTFLRNCAGKGGLLYLAEPFFDTMMQIMRKIMTAVTVYDFQTNPSTVWATGKKLVLSNATLKSDFMITFLRQVKQLRKADPSFPHVVNSDIARVFQIVVTKMCHARFGAVEDVYKELSGLKSKGHTTFRGFLLASTMLKGSNAEGRGSDATDTLITLPSPGKNGAVDCKFLKGKTILVQGTFPEVNSFAVVAQSTIQTFLEDFGAKVGKKFSNSTSYLLAGMKIPNDKIKTAETRKVRIINLKRLVHLLTGKLLSFEETRGLPLLSRVDFIDKNY